MTASLTISIDRTGMPGSLPPLVMSASPGGSGLGIVSYREPAMQPRIRYAPSSDYQHGDVALSWSWQQTLLNFEVMPVSPANEAASRAALAALQAAISRLRYEVTVTISGSTAEVWTCDAGSLTPSADRSRVDLQYVTPVWAVSIPCYPVRS